MQACRWFVKKKQRTLTGCLRKVAREFQPLRLAATQRRHGLTKFHITEPNSAQRFEYPQDVIMAYKKLARLVGGHFEDIGNRLAVDLHLEHHAAIPFPVAVGAAQIDVAEELNLNVLEAVPAARRAAAFAGIETKRARRITALLRHRLRGEKFADRIERADVAGRVRARGPSHGRLVHHHDVFDSLMTDNCPMPSRRFLGLVLEFAQRVVENILDKRRFPRTADARDADQSIEGYLDIDVLQVVLARTQNLQAWCLGPNGASLGRRRPLFLACEIMRGQRASALLQFRLGAKKNNFTAAFARPRAQVENAVRRADDIRVVLDDEQCIARGAEPMEDADETVDIARMQADAGFVEHIERIDQRSAQRRGEIDALDFAAAERARLAIKREVTEPHVHQVTQTRANFGKQKIRGFVERR